MIVKLDDYHKKDLTRKYDDLIRDAISIYEASYHLALAAVEMQLYILKALK